MFFMISIFFIKLYVLYFQNEKSFQIIYINEGINMAIYKNENPICIRVICKKIE